jgi:hypothetical protein
MPLPFTPIYDRTVSDVLNKNPKGYFNIEDWERVFENASELHDLVVSIFGYSTTIYEPTYGYNHVATLEDVNSLPANIEAIRAYLFSVNPDIVDIEGVVELKDDYASGPHELSPTFRNVNDWERVTYLLYTRLSAFVSTRKARAGVSVAGADMTKNNLFRSY